MDDCLRQCLSLSDLVFPFMFLCHFIIHQIYAVTQRFGYRALNKIFAFLWVACLWDMHGIPNFFTTLAQVTVKKTENEKDDVY